jgi:hypothetical protein
VGSTDAVAGIIDPLRNSAFCRWDKKGKGVNCAAGALDLSVLSMARDRKRKAPPDVIKVRPTLMPYNIKVAFYLLKSNGEGSQ